MIVPTWVEAGVSILQKIQLQIAAQDGKEKMVVCLTEDEVKEFLALPIKDIKSIYTLGAKSVHFDIIKKVA